MPFETSSRKLVRARACVFSTVVDSRTNEALPETVEQIRWSEVQRSHRSLPRSAVCAVTERGADEGLASGMIQPEQVSREEVRLSEPRMTPRMPPASTLQRAESAIAFASATEAPPASVRVMRAGTRKFDPGVGTSATAIRYSRICEVKSSPSTLWPAIGT